MNALIRLFKMFTTAFLILGGMYFMMPSGIMAAAAMIFGALMVADGFLILEYSGTLDSGDGDDYTPRGEMITYNGSTDSELYRVACEIAADHPDETFIVNGVEAE